MPASESRLARQVLGRNLKVRPGESVLIESWSHTLPWSRAFVEESRRLGAVPTVLYEDDDAWWSTVNARKTRALAKMSGAERAAVSAADVFIYFWGPEDRPRMAALPDSRQEDVTHWNEEWYRTARKAGLRGCRMTLGQASDASAKVWGIEGANWRRRLIEAGQVDGPQLRRSGQKILKSLTSGRELRIQHPNGTDVTIQLKGLHSRLESGIVDGAAMKRPYGMLTNNPSGQVMLGVDDSEATGHLVGNRAVFVAPNRFDGFDWTFEGGELTAHSLKSGAKAFEEAYAGGGPSRNRLSYLSIGLNPKARELPPVEDTEAGAVLLGVGSNAFVGGKVRGPFQGYAMVGGAKITVDGRTIADGGRLR